MNTLVKSRREMYVGQEKTMNCGYKCTIIGYNGANEVTVRFEDGVVRTGQRITDFRRGRIIHPAHQYDYRKAETAERYLGKKLMLNCGFEVEVIACDGSSNLTIKFEDGYIMNGVETGDLKAGTYLHPKWGRKLTDDAWVGYSVLYNRLKPLFPDLKYRGTVDDVPRVTGKSLVITFYSEKGRFAVDMIRSYRHTMDTKYDSLLKSGKVDVVYCIGYPFLLPDIDYVVNIPLRSGAKKIEQSLEEAADFIITDLGVQ